MRRVAVANRKGGVGKTTTACHLAHGLAIAGHRVLLIDTDSQAHCSALLGVTPEKGLAELLDGERVEPYEARDKLHLLAGGAKLAGAARTIARMDFDSHAVLAEALKPFEPRYDFFVFDTAPGASVLNVNVLVAAREILIPVNPELLTILGLSDFLGELERVTERFGTEIRYVLPTVADGRTTKTKNIIAQLEKHFGALVCDPISYSVEVSRLPATGRTIYEVNPKHRVARDYALLTRRVLDGQAA